MNIQPINMTNVQPFKGKITVKNVKNGAVSNFVTNEKTDLELFTYFKDMVRAIFSNFDTKEHVDALSKITKEDLGKGITFPKAKDFVGKYASKIVKQNGEEKGVNIIDASGYFRLEHEAPYVDVNIIKK